MTRLPRWLLAVLTLLVCTLQVPAQQPPPPGASPERPLRIRDISGGKVKTPEYSVKSGQAVARTKEWFQIITQYDTEPEWLDEVDFTYYVLVKSKDPKAPPQMLFKGDVTYLNVERGKHRSDMFLHPSTLARFGEVQAVGVEVKIQGRVVGRESKPASNDTWWDRLPPREGLVLNRLQTPFAMLSFDDFEAIKPK